MPKKLKLSNIKVQSFVTSLEDDAKKKVKGGEPTLEPETYCTCGTQCGSMCNTVCNTCATHLGCGCTNTCGSQTKCLACQLTEFC